MSGATTRRGDETARGRRELAPRPDAGAHPPSLRRFVASSLDFNRMPFRRKLTVLLTTATGIALVLVGAAVVVSDYGQMRARVLREVTLQAAITADNSRAALEFIDREVAAEILNALAADDRVHAAATYDFDRSLFAVFSRDGAVDAIPETAAAPGYRYEEGHLRLFHPVIQDGLRIGTIYIDHDLAWLYRHLLSQTAIVFGALAVSLCVSLLVTRRLKSALVQPIRHLAETAGDVSRRKNYAVRAVKRTADELGELTDAFNEMLSEIQTRDGELRRHRELLEERILERTADLEQARVAAESAEATSKRYAAALEKRNAALEEARAHAQLANRAKSEFLANMSHEIRSPMTAILGYAELLYRGEAADASPERRQALDTIMRNGRHLLSVINDILDLSKLEAGRMSVERVPCAPAQVVADVVELMQVRAVLKGLTLDVSYDTPIPETIASDPMRLRQILVNLVGNAIKFTKSGGVRLIASVDGAESSTPRLVVAVHDTGTGIEADQLDGLFDSFTQADSSTTRRFGGTGLGLSISRRFARLLGGDITAISRPGTGSTFTVTVDTGPIFDVRMIASPAEAAQATQRSRDADADRLFETARPLQDARILVAEDTPDNQRLIGHHLRLGCATVEIAADGRQAVEKALARERDGAPFDLILMDVQMPDLDGFEATRLLRSKGYRRPIVALTANAMRGDRERCLAAGMDDYVQKPIEVDQLFDAIRRALAGRPASPPPPTPTPPVDGDATAKKLESEPETPEVLDEAAARRRFGNDAQLLVELIDIYRDETRDRLLALRSAVDAGDLTTIEREAHAIKGSVANFGAADAADAARRLEDLARDDGRRAEHAAALADLERELQRLEPALESLRAKSIA